MPISVECSACRTSFRVRDEFAGKRGKCVKCKAPVDVPALRSEPAPAPAQPEESDTYALAGAGSARAVPVRKVAAETFSNTVVQAVAPTRAQRNPGEILAAFRGEIEPVRPTLGYRLWIVIVAGMMILLPLAYLAVIGVVAAALAWHAVHDLVILRVVRPGFLAAAIYVSPLVVGVIMIAFMFKPLFAGQGRNAKRRVLDPSKEPLLFAFVDGVCMSVGSPRPSRIEVDCQVNAAASRRSRVLGLFGNELTLTIGLPLAAGLSLKQFAGVLAHEFGHFSQGAGMRLSGFIRRVNGWFARAVYERDAWDESLADWSRADNSLEILIGNLGRVAVWLTRRVLWVFMVAGHAVSGFLLRQMEFDADRYEARMVGGAVFTETTRRIAELSLAGQGAMSDLAVSWQERRLPDDLPKLILANAGQLPDEARQVLRKVESEGRTGLFDTHPADKDRIARAVKEKNAGAFRLDGPATDLFRDFDTLSRAATLDYYRALLGRQISKDQLYPVAEAIEGQAVAQQGNEAFGRFFLKTFGTMQSFPLPTEYPTAPADLKAAKQALIEARSDMEAARDDYLVAQKQWHEALSAAADAEAARALLRTDNRIKASTFGLEEATPDGAEEAAAQAEADHRAAAATLEAFESAAARRMALALGLLESDAVAARVPDGPARREESRALYPCATLIGGRLLRDIFPVGRDRQAVTTLAGIFTNGDNTKNQALINACLRSGRQLHERLQQLHWKIGDAIDYPFEYAREGMTLGRFILPTVPHHEALGDLAEACDAAIEKIVTLNQRVLGRLTVTAELVERAFGLKPVSVEVEDATESPEA